MKKLLSWPELLNIKVFSSIEVVSPFKLFLIFAKLLPLSALTAMPSRQKIPDF